jgi:HlyD family secretion protein
MKIPVRRYRKWVIALLALLALGLALAGSTHGAKPIRVRIIHPELGSVAEIVTPNSVGTVEPVKTAVVAAEIVGKIARIPVRQGPVREGQTVVEIDSRDLEAEREVTRSEIKTARARIDEAVLRRKKVWEDLTRYQGVDVPKGDVERLERDLEIAKKAEEISTLSIRTLEAQLGVLELKLGKVRVAAPFDGTVSKLHCEEGESVTPGKSLFTVLSAGPLLVRAQIDEVDMGRVALGQAARITFDAYEGKTFDGGVHEIMPAASADQKNNRTVDVKILVPDMPPNIRANMSANVEIILRSHEKVLRIPSHLVQRDRLRNEKFVFVRERGVARKRTVQAGFANWSMTEISQGLSPQDDLILPLELTDEPPITDGAPVVAYDHGH